MALWPRSAGAGRADAFPYIPRNARPPADFAWFQQASAVETVNAAGWRRLAMPSPGSAQFTGRDRPVPVASEWAVTGWLTSAVRYDVINYFAFMYIRESGTGKMYTFGHLNGGLGATVSVDTWTAPATVNANIVSINKLLKNGPIAAWRIRRTASGYAFDTSEDNAGFVEVASVLTTAHFTTAADRIGFCGYLPAGGTAGSLALQAWKEE
jgi:hypothetical protein